MLKKVSKLNNSLIGTVAIPADKSISHRAVMFCSLAKGKSIIKNFSCGADPKSSLEVFQNLGVQAEFTDNKTLTIKASGKFVAPANPLNCGNSGTTMRLISGILASQDFNSTLIGDESLSRRPMKRIIEPLTLMGAELLSDNGHAPIKIIGKHLNAINYNSKLSSAQVKSCVLLAGLNAKGITTFTEPVLSRNHSELLLKFMGADIQTCGNTVKIQQSQLEPKEIAVCGDISSAAFFIAAALIVPNSDITLKNIGLNPTRTGIIDVVKNMGGDIEILDIREISGELVGDVRVKYSELKGCTIEKEIIPRLIDEIPIIAVLASVANGETIIRDAQDLRNKETDRISTVALELGKLGTNITETNDGLIINGQKYLSGGVEVNSYKDHRLAMSFYIAGLICKNPINIKDFEWVNISFPEFEHLIKSLTKL